MSDYGGRPVSWFGVFNLPQLVAEHEVHAPTLVIVGEVVTLREKLAWFDKG